MLRSLAVVSLFMVLIAPAAGAEPAGDAPELNVFRRLVGEWDVEMVVKSGENLGNEQTVSGRISSDFILDGRYFQQEVELQAVGDFPGAKHRTLFTFDKTQQTYRHWMFTSSGPMVEGTGSWNGDTKMFTWEAKAEHGITSTSVSTFPEDGVEEWTVSVKSAEGITFLEFAGKTTRRKP